MAIVGIKEVKLDKISLYSDNLRVAVINLLYSLYIIVLYCKAIACKCNATTVIWLHCYSFYSSY